MPPGLTLDVLILQVLTVRNLGNIGIPVVPPGVTLVVFFFAARLSC